MERVLNGNTPSAVDRDKPQIREQGIAGGKRRRCVRRIQGRAQRDESKSRGMGEKPGK